MVCTHSASPHISGALLELNHSGTAVIEDGKPYGFCELNQKADIIANELLEYGVEPGAPVALELSRSFERLAAIVGTWRAGAVVLALDPAWPASRVSAILQACEAQYVIDSASRVRGLATRAESLGAGAVRGVLKRADPDSLAYLVYTSGSSGTPKGVEIRHRNFANLIDWHVAEFSITPRDRVAHIAGLGFDAAFWEVWPALCAGAAVVLPTEAARLSPRHLQEWLLGSDISCAFVPTFLAEQMIFLPWPARSAFRLMLTGGEQLRMRPPERLPFVLVNNYGPSECTVVATSGIVRPCNDPSPPPIGWPIAGVQIEICDDAGHQVPDGQVGEIRIGGAGVGRGYHKDPFLTALSFVTEPRTGQIIYRSGDLGRRNEDGGIAFLGRIDEQEQIRGVRVEPAEISVALQRHDAVQWATVLGRPGSRGRELAAYILIRDGFHPTAEELCDFLGHSFPEAMIPASFEEVREIPLTASGKIDLSLLKQPGFATPLPRHAYRAPSNAIETLIADSISELLGGLKVGVDDNFFLLGGHSLLATQLVLRLRSQFDVTLSLRQVFGAPSIGALAACVVESLSERLSAMSDEEAGQWIAD